MGKALRLVFCVFATFLFVLTGISGSYATDSGQVRDIFYEGTIVLDRDANLTPEEALDQAERISDQPRQRVPAGGNAYWGPVVDLGRISGNY